MPRLPFGRQEPRLKAMLNGVDLALADDMAPDSGPYADIWSRIYLENIRESVKIRENTVKRARYGILPTGAFGHDSIDVELTVFLKDENPVNRITLARKAMAWARGGWLTLSTRPGMRLYVIRSREPDLEAASRKGRITLTLTGYWEAYWQAVSPVTEEGSLTALKPGGEYAYGINTEITPGGDVDGWLEVLITNTASAAMTKLCVSSNTHGDSITLEQLSIAQGEQVRIFYDHRHFFYIATDGPGWQTSLLPNRTTGSSDDLRLTHGAANAIQIEADRAADFILTSYALYL